MRKKVYSILIVAILVVGGSATLTDHCPEWLYWQIYGYQLDSAAIKTGWIEERTFSWSTTVTPEEYVQVVEKAKANLTQ